MVAGVVVIAYAAAVVFWRDPVTDVITSFKQDGMTSALRAEELRYGAIAATVPAPALDPGAPAADATIAKAHRLGVAFGRDRAARVGQPIGRIRIRRIGLRMILVQGTDTSSLQKGPGHYPETAFPGVGDTVGVAGHRTTYAAPFRHIDDLRKGDPIVLTMPYGTFTYEVTRHAIVDNNDWSIIRDPGYEQLVLSACHPLYAATQRYVVFARLVSIQLPGAAAAVPV
jgi:sortase A